MSTLFKIVAVLGGTILLLLALRPLGEKEEKNKSVLTRPEILQNVPKDVSTTSIPLPKESFSEKSVQPKPEVRYRSSVDHKIDIPVNPVKTNTVQEVFDLKNERQTAVATTTDDVESKIQESTPPVKEVFPPLDEESILKAIVKIQCATEDGLGKYVGSGFSIKEDRIVTAAHVVKDSGSENCNIIFPNERRPVHYLRGEIKDFKALKSRHDEEGIDVAVLNLPSLEGYPEGRAIFKEYPTVPYPVCKDPNILGDNLLHFGYPSNYLEQTYLSRLEGKALVYADIKGIKEQLSEDATFTFKTPVFGYTYDETVQHPYIISRVASFYGDSGGLAFNKDKQCILGPHRGGTIGKASGENYSIFMNLGWSKTAAVLPSN